MSFFQIVEGFFEDLLEKLLSEFLPFFDEMMGDLLYATFFIESLPGLDETILTSDTVTLITHSLYAVMLVLLIIKILEKGGSIYILWRDGDPENPPGEMVVGGAAAVIVAAAFPVLYYYGVRVIEWIISIVDEITGAQLDFGVSVGHVIDIIDIGLGITFMMLVLILIFVVLYIIMLFMMLKQGAEMLLFRLCVPFASIGLVNSDGGAWKPFIQALFRMMATSLARYCLVCLSVRVIIPMNPASLAVGIALMITAICSPQILQQFMLQRSGGGMMQKAYALSMVMRTFGR